MKKTIITLLGILFLFSSAFSAKAGSEIGDYGVDTTFQTDFSEKKSIRSDAIDYTITDNGRFSNQYDVVRIGVYYNNFTIDSLIAEGYRTIVLEITMSVKEINDGYQYIFIYDDTSNRTLLIGGIFEHGEGYKETNERVYCFYCEIDIQKIFDNDFVIRYGASGKYDDDWSNRDVSFQLGASKEMPKTGNFWSLSKIGNTIYSYKKLPFAR